MRPGLPLPLIAIEAPAPPPILFAADAISASFNFVAFNNIPHPWPEVQIVNATKASGSFLEVSERCADQEKSQNILFVSVGDHCVMNLKSGPFG